MGKRVLTDREKADNFWFAAKAGKAHAKAWGHDVGIHQPTRFVKCEDCGWERDNA